MKTAKELVYDMLKANTGIAMMDSGGDEGREWQRNAKKTLADFENEPEVSIDWGMPEEGETVDSTDLTLCISLFHYLPQVLMQDEVCAEFNALPCEDWEGGAYGVSKDGEGWLTAHSFTYGVSWNTYNGENNLSQVLQGTELKHNGETGVYVLIQVHGGADVRGGYTDAKLFRYRDSIEYPAINPCPSVYGTLTKPNGDTFSLDTSYNGHSLTDENGEAVKVEYGDSISLELSV